MIDLIAIRDYIKAFAQAHSYIQHNEAVRAYNRFVTYDFDESNTGDTGATAFPRLSLVANSRFGGYNGKMEQQGGQPLKATMQMEVSVVNTYPEGNYRRHDEVSNETLKVLTDLVSYLHANQKAQKCHPVLQHINFNSFQFFKTKLQTHGNAIGWALSFELGARIDSDFSGSIPPPLPMPPTPVGSLFCWNGTQYAPLPPAAAGNILKSQGLNTPPAWEPDGGAEADPIFTDWLSNVAKVAEWNNAYSWGNHAAAGYALQTDLTNEATARTNADNAIISALNNKEDKANKNTGALTNNPNTYPSEKTVYDALQAVSSTDPLEDLDIIDDFIGYLTVGMTGIAAASLNTSLHFIEKGYGWTYNNKDENQRAGIIEFYNNYTSGNYCRVSTGRITRGADTGVFKTTHIFKLTGELSSITRPYTVTVGLVSDYPNHIASGNAVCVEYSSVASQFVCRTVKQSVGNTQINSGVTVALDTWYKVEIELTATEAIFKINDVVVGTITTNIPSSYLTGFAGVYKLNNNATPFSMQIDFARYQKTLDNPR